MINVDITHRAGDKVVKTSLGDNNGLSLVSLERLALEHAIKVCETREEAAKFLGITRHALKRRIIKHNLRWPEASAS